MAILRYPTKDDPSKLLMKDWRTALLPEEREVWVPGIDGKLESIEDGFEQLLDVLKQAKGDPYLTGMLQQLAMSQSFNAQKYCADIEHNIVGNFIKPIQGAKRKKDAAKDLASLALYLQSVDAIRNVSTISRHLFFNLV